MTHQYIKFSDQLLSDSQQLTKIKLLEARQDTRRSQPGVYASLIEDNAVHTSFEIYATEQDYFFQNQAIYWRDWWVLGCGCHVHFISAVGEKIKNYSLGDSGFAYFLAFCNDTEIMQALGDNFLLVTSGTGLSLFNDKAELRWQTNGLAVDGVVVKYIEDNIISGSVEIDPPGGWEEIKINVTDGSVNESE